ncbi:DNA alkylation repair protein [Chloroflexota bacterium]
MEPLKNMYNDAFFQKLVGAITGVYADFEGSAFLALIYDDAWEGRELKARMRHITVTLHDCLPADYRVALDIICRASQAVAGGFGPMIFPDFVELYGLDDWEASLPALELFTQQSSAEFAVRPFILQDQDRMMAQMVAWTQHESEHLRRLASEGCRPRLPWAVALPAFKADPTPILPVLENLKLDSSEYVRRSVANNLNDISKDNPQVVLAVLRGWQDHKSRNMERLTGHALRTLIKAGDPAALALLGYAANPAVDVRDLAVTPGMVKMGEALTFSFELVSHGAAAQNLMVDYAVHYVRANGKTSRKVFKLTKKKLGPGEVSQLTRKLDFKPISTRRYYPGEHALEVQVNGAILARVIFLVE